MTKIRYSKERLRSHLTMGVIFVTIGIILVLLSIVIGDWTVVSIQSVGVGQIGAGIFMCIMYYFENKTQYLTLKNGLLIKNTLVPKKIKLSEITSIKESAGDLKLIIEKSEFIIDTQIIAPNSLAELKNELKNYNLK
tara:strand:- start:50 stop:460 length:411 start_codon:yes stop_codon:yes gene_type:complete